MSETMKTMPNLTLSQQLTKKICYAWGEVITEHKEPIRCDEVFVILAKSIANFLEMIGSQLKQTSTNPHQIDEDIRNIAMNILLRLD